MREDSVKFLDLVRLILDILRYSLDVNSISYIHIYKVQ